PYQQPIQERFQSSQVAVQRRKFAKILQGSSAPASRTCKNTIIIIVDPCNSAIDYNTRHESSRRREKRAQATEISVTCSAVSG
ncbi:hypothetical protein OSTOST_15478, partial [Ostertagia ostertagi]